MPFPIIGGGPGDYFGATIANACRFNDDDSAQLSRTPAGAGDSRRMTISGWVKPGNVVGPQILLAARRGVGLNGFYVEFQDSNASRLAVFDRDGSGTNLSKISTASFRDPSAWYHVVAAIDTGQGTADDRCKVWINGTRITSWGTNINYPINEDLAWMNTTAIHYIGPRNDAGPYSDGYMAETIFVDGQALGPENFGETHPITGQWVPKTYTGSYGTNGFRLDYADAADLGNDVSGNANDFTASGLAANDQVPDTPTNNYPTLNPIDEFRAVSGDGGTLADGNLAYASHATLGGGYASTFAVDSGKWYAEFELTGSSSTRAVIGALRASTDREDWADDTVYYRAQDGAVLQNNSTQSTQATYGVSDVVGVVIDADVGTIEFLKNGVSQVTQAITGSGPIHFFVGDDTNISTVTLEARFGAHGFEQSIPNGARALTARNLTDPGILRGDNYFAANARTGTGSSGSVSILRFQPDLVWNKSRDEGTVSYTGDHKLWDAVRGVTKSLESNTPDQEATEGTGLTAFNADGFDFGALDQINFSGDAFIDWCWKEGAPAGLDIVRYSGDNTANRNIAHALSVAPEFALVKRLDASEDWFAWHAGLSGDVA